jgi:hypothetical protein
MSLLIVLAIPEIVILGTALVLYVSSLFKRPEQIDWQALDGWNR